MNKVEYDRPREKVKTKGVRSLNDGELLQLIIGSGTGGNSVSKIARKATLLLKKHGSGVSYQQLMTIQGLGPARVSQLLAMFELASRYPVDTRRLSLVSNDAKYQQLKTEVLTNQELGYMTLDGAGRLIRQRKLKYEIHNINLAIRNMSADAVNDKAAHLWIGRFLNDRLLIPALADLDIARSIAHVGQLLGFATGYIIFNHQDWHSVTKDVSHVER